MADAQKVLIQLLLPTRVDGLADAQLRSAIGEVYRELLEAFGGVTGYLRSPARGAWTAPDGHSEPDEVVMLEVVAPRFERSWWRAYSQQLSARFRQDAMHVRALRIEMLDEAGS